MQILEKSYHDKEEDGEGFDINLIKSFTKKNFPKTRHKLKAQTSKIVSSFKTSAVSCSFVREFKVLGYSVADFRLVQLCKFFLMLYLFLLLNFCQGHRDGIWDISVSNLNSPLVGTASADRTAAIWAVETGKCLLRKSNLSGSTLQLNKYIHKLRTDKRQ